MAKKTANDMPDDPRRKPQLDPELVEAQRDGVMRGREELKELVERITVGKMMMEMTSEMYVMNAKMRWNWYSALVEAGFNPDQAMTILLHGD